MKIETALKNLVKTESDSCYIQAAKRELPGFRDDADEMDKLMGEQILELLAVFSTHGHSGFSAPMAIAIFEKLANHKPLGPLTGEDSEWLYIGDGRFQNIRASHVFKDEDGRVYDMNGKVFKLPDGCCYTSRASRVYFDFPYTPKTEYVDVDE